ncbi:M13 family metallopeptidase [Riemerella columbina]|uniref:M13 family metallopeptidase n=1 Tax=Riemerella columbina TaxID=103810 RepID=UPI0026706830|nr:M13 family metallopeptidase [Riemerella columbina]WKS94833.1 M13 family metallopeptidase [Riemerella columbina]
MKKLSISLLSLSGLLAFQSCSVQSQQAAKAEQHTLKENHAGHQHADEGIALQYMDTSVRPQDDFYNYVNGGWMKTAVIPSDKASWGSFNELREKTDEASLNILNNILNKKYAEGSEGQKIQNLYASFMDMSKRNAEGIAPIQADLAKIDAIKNMKDLQAYFIDRVKHGGGNPLYDWGAYADMKNSKMNAIYLGGPRLGLGRDYYQKENAENAKTIAEYQKYVAKLLSILGYKNPEVTASQIVALEKDFAKNLLTLEEGRDANKRYNPRTSAELSQLSKNIDLNTYLKQVGVDTDKVIIGEIKYYENLDRFLNEKNLPLIKDYLKEKLLASNADNLDQRLDDIHFDFYGKYLQGQKEQRPMNKRGLSLINGVLGEAFGKLYVSEYFPAEAKAEMQTLIDYLKKSYHQHISNLDWMSPETKKKALEKLSKFTVKVAYPDKWEDYSALALNGNNLYENLKQVGEWEYNKSLKEEVNKPVDKSKWGMTPQTVNAYYNASNNEIVFPAAILQPPFFNFKADPAVNFGGIGAVIGHEISHGFDDGGSRFDGDGNLNNWWTEEDRKNFDIKVKQLADQYSKYEPVKGNFVNGVFTSGENIADLGGVAIAYDALKMYLKDKGNPGEISGFNQDQRFFLSWATVWRTKSTDQYMINQVKTDPHSPGYFRSFGPLVNVDAWYEAFGVKPQDRLYKTDEQRIKIW